MLTAPGAPMMDIKLFVTRLHDPFADLFERWWDGDEWIWVDHGRPGGMAVTGVPGAAMMNEKTFVVVADGALWELNWRNDLTLWVWDSHGRPANFRIVAEPGAAMMNRKFFVTVEDGHLWERDWRSDLGRWAWQDHGAPPGTATMFAPGAAMQDTRLFVAGANGRLFERFWDGAQWVWADRGAPPGTTVLSAAAGMNDSRLFLCGANGHLYEAARGERGVLSWTDHGQPPGTNALGTPAIRSSTSVWVRGGNSRLYELSGGDGWVWVEHGTPWNTSVATAPAAAMMDSKLFVGTADSHLWERFWTGTEWKWVNHGSARQDESQHVVGAPGRDPKLTIAVLGDGFAEEDLNDYVKVVEDQVLAALSSDQLADHQQALRVIRVDVVSMESGVEERRYDEAGTTITSDVFSFSRLGIIPNDRWKSCWFDGLSYTESRIEKLRRRFAPDADHVIVMVNSQTWGGCNSGTVARFTRAGGWVVIAHECGHNLFALDDEYVNDTMTFTGTSTQANTSEALADWTALKWSGLVASGAPLPTDAASPPSGWDARTSVGAFEGAGGWFEHGLFRPVLECRMNQNDPPWCPVCTRKINQDLAPFE
ncbi:MAG: hypothetical protein AUI15_16320 [Actinobacteria bacterium 13_2_20CM_2_66_6]|nr:MAG: hypothetical protein AUI15_16320 [Actinobacteria bacterium 13_2_20CM_2_66_6]